MPSSADPSIDLNQVRTFVLVYETRSVTAAAALLHVTQPTVSYTLGKLRRRFGDSLFRRTAAGLEPTTTATRLYGPWRSALTEIEQTVALVDDFDPARAVDSFVLALSDLGELSFLPAILAATKDQAPGVTVQAQPLVIDAGVDWLVEGRVDLVVTSAHIRDSRIVRHPFLEVDYVVLAAADHPRLSGRRLTARRFAAERHVEVVGTTGHAGPAALLRAHGLDREVALRLSSFSALPYVLERTELLGMVPRHIAAILGRHHEVVVHDIPWPLAPIEVATYTRHLPTLSSAQQWFVDLVRTELAAVAAQP